MNSVVLERFENQNHQFSHLPFWASPSQRDSRPPGDTRRWSSRTAQPRPCPHPNVRSPLGTRPSPVAAHTISDGSSWKATGSHLFCWHDWCNCRQFSDWWGVARRGCRRPSSCPCIPKSNLKTLTKMNSIIASRDSTIDVDEFRTCKDTKHGSPRKLTNSEVRRSMQNPWKISARRRCDGVQYPDYLPT
jgi:hypothetical protein